MGLTSALVDKARIVRQEAATGGRVAGSTVMVMVELEWFDAMLQLPQGQWAPESAGGRRRVVVQPTLLFDVLDHVGDPVNVRAGDRIVVESERFGLTTWEAVADPERLANLYDVIGYQVALRRVADHSFTPVAP